MRIAPILALICGLCSPSCSLYFEQDPGDAPPQDSCEIRSDNGFVPGSPFDFGDYQQVVWPLTQRGCGVAGCHAANDGFSSGFEVWPEDGDPCSVNRSFNELYDHSDYLVSPANSLVLVALDGRMATHPVQPGPGSVDYTVIYDFIWEAWLRTNGGPSSAYFDFELFQDEIQPMLDSASCGAIGCHDLSSAYAGFSLYPQPARGSTEMLANFQMATSFVDLRVSPPDETRLFMAATNWHAGTAVSATDTLRRWLRNAFDEFNGIVY